MTIIDITSRKIDPYKLDSLVDLWKFLVLSLYCKFRVGSLPCIELYALQKFDTPMQWNNTYSEKKKMTIEVSRGLQFEEVNKLVSSLSQSLTGKLFIYIDCLKTTELAL